MFSKYRVILLALIDNFCVVRTTAVLQHYNTSVGTAYKTYFCSWMKVFLLRKMIKISNSNKAFYFTEFTVLLQNNRTASKLLRKNTTGKISDDRIDQNIFSWYNRFFVIFSANKHAANFENKFFVSFYRQFWKVSVKCLKFPICLLWRIWCLWEFTS